MGAAQDRPDFESVASLSDASFQLRGHRWLRQLPEAGEELVKPGRIMLVALRGDREDEDSGRGTAVKITKNARVCSGANCHNLQIHHSLSVASRKNHMVRPTVRAST